MVDSVVAAVVAGPAGVAPEARRVDVVGVIEKVVCGGRRERGSGEGPRASEMGVDGRMVGLECVPPMVVARGTQAARASNTTVAGSAHRSHAAAMGRWGEGPDEEKNARLGRGCQSNARACEGPRSGPFSLSFPTSLPTRSPWPPSMWCLC